jgi:hypothetical protein
MTQSRSPVHPFPQPARQPARPPTRPAASTQSHRFLTPAGRGTAPTRRELPGGQALGFLCVWGRESLGPPSAREEGLCLLEDAEGRRGESRRPEGGVLLCCAAAAAQCGGGLPEVEGGARTRLGARKESIVLYKTSFFGRLGIAAVAAVGGLWWWGRGPAG